MSKIKTILTGALVVVAIIFKLYQGWDDKQLASRDGSITPAESGLFSDKFTSVKTSGAGLELLSKCRLITGRNGDGDSFHVKHEKGETEFRLYFVDTPESQYKTYGGGESNGKRLDQQAAYFGMSWRYGRKRTWVNAQPVAESQVEPLLLLRPIVFISRRQNPPNRSFLCRSLSYEEEGFGDFFPVR
ncbi:hypothetical protein N9113_04845 [Akkermansiaceae bacterium]|nr:hypothetical protein [Akkermansiaceae bacterium]